MHKTIKCAGFDQLSLKHLQKCHLAAKLGFVFAVLKFALPKQGYLTTTDLLFNSGSAST